MNTILIVGGAGYIGSVISYCFAKIGARVVIIDTYLHAQSFNPTWADLFIGDCTDSTFLNTVFKQYTFDCVIHCAALIEVGKSVTNPLPFYHHNINGLIQVLNAMVAHHVPMIIFSSSSAVYGEPFTQALSTDHPTAPINPYGYTKLVGEHMLATCAKAYGFTYSALRYFNVAGALPEQSLGENHKPETHILPLLIEAALEKKPFTIFGTHYPTKDGTAVRDYVHVYDVARAHVHAYEHMLHTKQSDTFNIGSGIGTSIKELIDIVQEVMKVPLMAHHGPERIGDPAQLIADISRTSTVLNWQPTHSSIHYIVQSAVAYAYLQKELPL